MLYLIFIQCLLGVGGELNLARKLLHLIFPITRCIWFSDVSPGGCKRRKPALPDRTREGRRQLPAAPPWQSGAQPQEMTRLNLARGNPWSLGWLFWSPQTDFCSSAGMEASTVADFGPKCLLEGYRSERSPSCLHADRLSTKPMSNMSRENVTVTGSRQRTRWPAQTAPCPPQPPADLLCWSKGSTLNSKLCSSQQRNPIRKT